MDCKPVIPFFSSGINHPKTVENIDYHNPLWLKLRYRAGAACGLAEMETVCLENGRKLSPLEWKKLEESYLCFRSAFSKLASHALSKGLPRWHLRPKMHYLEHAVFDFDGKNLRHMSNFLDEDMIRRVKSMAVAANPRCVSKHVLYRYAVCACLKWSGMIG